MRWLFALLLLSGVAFAQSPPQPANQSAQAEQPAAKDERGTEASPVFVKVIPTPKTEAETKAESEDRAEKANTDTWIERWTGAVAVFTLILAGVGAWQGIQLKRSVDLAREEFIATHRPKISVLDFRFFGERNKPQKIAFTYINVGDSKAIVTNTAIEILNESRKTPPGGMDLTDHPVEPPLELANGEAGFGLSKEDFSAGAEYFAGLGNAGTLFCISYVMYSDESGASRRTGFCRRFDPDSHRWVRVEDEDYEHSY